MPTITVLVIPADDSQPLRTQEIERNDLTAMQQLVDGYMEGLHLYNPDGTLFVNEDGKMRGLPDNPRATLLWRVHNPTFLSHDAVCGDAFITGSASPGGNDTSVSAMLVQLLTAAKVFAIEVQESQGMPWKLRAYDIGETWREAYTAAIVILKAEPETEAVRVRPI